MFSINAGAEILIFETLLVSNCASHIQHMDAGHGLLWAIKLASPVDFNVIFTLLAAEINYSLHTGRTPWWIRSRAFIWTVVSANPIVTYKLDANIVYSLIDEGNYHMESPIIATFSARLQL